jgi:hypothetical protein
VSLLPTKFHEILFSSFRVALTNCVMDRRTGRQTGQNQYGGRHNKGNNSETTNVRYFQIKVVISNPTHGEVNLIQHYVIKVCQWLAVGRWLSLGTPVSSTYKTDDITEILLKVVLNTITLTLTVSRDNNIRRLYHINICQILTSAILIFFFWK